jgi:hypothetical protein
VQQGARRFPGRPEHIGAARRFVAAALVAWPATQEAARLLLATLRWSFAIHRRNRSLPARLGTPMAAMASLPHS